MKRRKKDKESEREGDERRREKKLYSEGVEVESLRLKCEGVVMDVGVVKGK